jgi:hypothetical protein
MTTNRLQRWLHWRLGWPSLLDMVVSSRNLELMWKFTLDEVADPCSVCRYVWRAIFTSLSKLHIWAKERLIWSDQVSINRGLQMTVTRLVLGRRPYSVSGDLFIHIREKKALLYPTFKTSINCYSEVYLQLNPWISGQTDIVSFSVYFGLSLTIRV